MPKRAKHGKKTTAKRSRKSISSKGVWRGKGTGGFSISQSYAVLGSKSALTNYGPFPTRKHAILRYAESGVANYLTCGTAGVGGTEHTLVMGSLFDPALTLTGHQPYFFDQVAAVYQHYRVNSITVRIRAYDPSTAGSILAWQLDTWNGAAGTLAGVSPTTALERPNTGRLQPNTTFDKEETVIPWTTIAKLEGLTTLEHRTNIEDYAALVTASPARTPYLRLACMNTEGNNSGALYYAIEVLFDCEFWNRQVVATS